MSLTEKLLSLDSSKYKEKATSEIEIKRLSKMVGEPFLVKLQEVEAERLQELQAMIIDKKGNYDLTQARKVNALICCAGVVEPSLSDKKLQDHFNVASPKELAEILFKGVELTQVADEIARISNFVQSDEEEEVTKN
jgi:hypothetical protein